MSTATENHRGQCERLRQKQGPFLPALPGHARIEVLALAREADGLLRWTGSSTAEG